MENINIKTTTTYLSIQEGFEWIGIPQFAIITGVNGAGKTHLLKLLQDSKVVDIFNNDGKIVDLVLSIPTIQTLNLDGLIAYKNQLTQRLLKQNELNRQINRYKDNIHNIKHQIKICSDKLESQRLSNELKKYTDWLNNNKKELKVLHIYAYEEELQKVLYKTGKKDVEEITDIEIREYANPYFNALSEIKDFEKFIKQEEDIRNEQYIKLAKEKRECDIPRVRDEERAFEKINRLFKKYGFDYYEMQDPFPTDKTRNGHIIFKGRRGEDVQYGALSSGEQMIVKFIIWAMATDIRGNRINTMLLDEPDAHLHPSMCKMMVEILQEITQPKELGGSGIRVIITTHSPSTVAFAPTESLFVMEKDANNDRIIKQTSTEEAVRILSDGIFTFEKAVNQFTLIADSNKNNILFVEGKTDVNHLNKAIGLLGYDLDLEIFDLHDAGTLSNFIRSAPAKLCSGKRLIALFDCDDEGKKLFKNISGDMIMDNIKRLTASQCENKSFALTLQAPDKLDKYCPIEFLYPFEYLKPKMILKKLDFREYKSSFKATNPEDDRLLNEEYEKETFLRPYKVNDDEKNRFSESIKSEADAEIFNNFRPTLDLIQKIIEYKDGI